MQKTMILAILAVGVIAIAGVGAAFAYQASYTESEIPASEDALVSKYITITKGEGDNPSVPTKISAEFSTKNDPSATDEKKISTLLIDNSQDILFYEGTATSASATLDFGGADAQKMATAASGNSYSVTLAEGVATEATVAVYMGEYKVKAIGETDLTIDIEASLSSANADVTFAYNTSSTYATDLSTDGITLSGFDTATDNTVPVYVWAKIDIKDIFVIGGTNTMDIPSMTVSVVASPHVAEEP